MRAAKWLSIFLLIPQFCHSGNASGDSKDFLLSLHKAGKLTIGMGVEEVVDAYGRDNVKLVDIELEGSFTPALDIYIKGSQQQKPSIEAEIGCREGMVIWRATVLDQRFKTEKGIGIGSRLAEINDKYTITNGYVGEGTVGVYVYEIQMSFRLSIDAADLPQEFLDKNDFNLIPDTTSVNAIGVGWRGY